MSRILIRNASEILTMEGAGWEPLKGERQNRIRIRTGASVLIEDGIIRSVMDDSKADRLDIQDAQIVDAHGRTVMPGLVDSHTHIAYAGSREEEFYMKMSGKSYLDILNAGHGIYRTVRDTRNANENDIFSQTLQRVYDSVVNGTTAMEIKTGYGLDMETEMKMMRVIERIESLGLVKVVPTFLPLHAVPQGMTEGSYVHGVIETMLPRFRGKCRFVDSFCDKGAFSPETTDEFFRAAEQMGFKLKLHADEIAEIGCTSLCEKHRISTVDHLINTSGPGMERIRRSGAIACILPITAFNIADGRYPSGSELMNHDIPVAIASDVSPISCNSNMFFAIYLAVRYCGLSIEAALNAATINGAFACGEGEIRGSIEAGKKADILILTVDSYRKIPYQYGSRLVDTVIHDGEIVVRGGSPAL
ncbi:MAG TPA: imidazolonepropionase [Thermoplasmataceae archaeon]|nr:imidazolonepropionase [Thermoplasmatales archaeon AK]HLH85720.1 imidazolonepropionase [Thermoplasmataceae archaeon]